MLKTSLRPSCFFSLPQAVGDVSAQIQRDAQRVSFLKQENTEVATLVSHTGCLVWADTVLHSTAQVLPPPFPPPGAAPC